MIYFIETSILQVSIAVSIGCKRMVSNVRPVCDLKCQHMQWSIQHCLFIGETQKRKELFQAAQKQLILKF